MQQAPEGFPAVDDGDTHRKIVISAGRANARRVLAHCLAASDACRGTRRAGYPGPAVSPRRASGGFETQGGTRGEGMSVTDQVQKDSQQAPEAERPPEA